MEPLGLIRVETADDPTIAEEPFVDRIDNDGHNGDDDSIDDKERDGDDGAGSGSAATSAMAATAGRCRGD